MSGPRVLVVRFGALGDVVLTTPLLRVLARAHAAADVTVVTREAYAPLLETNPHVTRVIPLRPRERIRHLAARLRGHQYDWALDLQRSPRSLFLRRTVPGRWVLYPKDRIGRLQLVWLGTASRPVRPVVERYFAATAPLGLQADGRPAEVFPTPEDEARAEALAPRGVVALAPGASRATKRWPPDRWRALAAGLAALRVPVVGLGSAPEHALLPGPSVIPGYGLPLLTTAALLRRARVAVVNDSGLMHLAAAVGCPVVALLGPTVRAQGVLPYGTSPLVIERALHCRPCAPFGSDHCPLGHHRCMMEIGPDLVMAAIEAAA